MSGYKDVTCENCHDLWSVIDPEYPWLCCYCRKEEFRIYGPAGSSQSLSSRGDGRASLVQGCHDPRGGGPELPMKYAQVCGGLHDPRPWNFKYTETAPPVPPREEWPKLVKAEPEPSPEDQMLSDMQEQLQTARNEKQLAQQDLLNSLKSLRDERVRNLDLLRDVIAYQNALKASEESLTWYSALAKKYVSQTVDLELRLHELQNTLWARFKRWMKEQWESEVNL